MPSELFASKSATEPQVLMPLPSRLFSLNGLRQRSDADVVCSCMMLHSVV